MMKIEKKALRKQIAEEKRRITAYERAVASHQLLEQLENHPRFITAHTVLLYYSLPDEVATQAFIEKWGTRKQLLLPVVVGDDLKLCHFTGTNNLKESERYKIGEPMGEAFTNYNFINLAIIPGVAFDKQGNRLGRGKGYYDRLLQELTCYTIGICFDFQLLELLPTESFDRPMNEVWTEKGRVF